jgi:hypothetical protein
MVSWSESSSDSKRVPKKQPANFRVRFRHGVYPNPEGEATRAEIKKYDYFFSGKQTWVTTSANCKIFFLLCMPDRVADLDMQLNLSMSLRRLLLT